jgi:hypothetical protein
MLNIDFFLADSTEEMLTWDLPNTKIKYGLRFEVCVITKFWRIIC